jgi:hypothetical protein
MNTNAGYGSGGRRPNTYNNGPRDDQYTPNPKKIITPDTSEAKHRENQQYEIDNLDGQRQELTENIHGSGGGGATGGGDGSVDGLRKELLIMTIEIGDGQQDTLYVYEDDDPYQVAIRFCKRHNLNENIVFPLSQNIYNNMEQVLKERVELLDLQNLNGTGKSLQQQQQQQNLADGSDRYDDTQQFKPATTNTITTNSASNYYDGPGGSLNAQKYLQEAEKTSTQIIKFTDTGNFSRTQHTENPQHTTTGQESLESYGTFNPNKTVSIYNRNYGSTKDGQTKDLESTQEYNSAQLGATASSSAINLTQSLKNSKKMSMSEAKLRSGTSTGKLDFTENMEKENDYLDNLINESLSMAKDKRGFQHPTDLTFTPQINQTSQLIVGCKFQNSRINVYDRLHNDAKVKLKKSINNSTQNFSGSGNTTLKGTKKSISQTNPEINYGSLLYHKGMKRKEEVIKEMTIKRKEDAERAEEECTFKPNLNPISTEIINGKTRQEPHEELLIKYGKACKEKVDRARNIKQIEEIESCSFKPIINTISQKIAVEKANVLPNGPERFIKLHDDHKVKMHHQKHLANLLHSGECTFTPVINNYHSASLENMSFEERNRKFMARLEKIDHARKDKEEGELIDPSTGKPLFQPEICRYGKNMARNNEGLPVGEYLYNRRIEQEHNKKMRHELEQKSVEANMARSNEKSTALLDNIKRRKLTDIFRLFDSDGDGVISSTKIDISAIDTSILEAFAPLLCEMEELNQTLTHEEFLEAADRLLRSLSIDERDRLLLDRKYQQDRGDNHSFKPQINKKSAAIASRIRPYGDTALYDVYINERKVFHEKVAEANQRKKDDELRECSFKPQLVSSSATPVISLNPSNYFSSGLF